MVDIDEMDFKEVEEVVKEEIEYEMDGGGVGRGGDCRGGIGVGRDGGGRARRCEIAAVGEVEEEEAEIVQQVEEEVEKEV